MAHDDHTELHVYDFDGTLFRSPTLPSWWPRKRSWWIDPRSLNRPCVPDAPGPDWWVEPVVSSARTSISNPNVWAVMMTGRNARRGSFSYRVPELLKQKGLNFDEVHLTDTHDTKGFKKQKIRNVINRYPHISVAQFWDDRGPFLEEYVQMIEATGREAIPHLVETTPHEPDCGPEDIKEASIAPSKNIRVNGHRYELVGG